MNKEREEKSLLTIVIPAYNESESLPSLLERIIPFAKEKNWRIVIVNDGSTDTTKDILDAEKVRAGIRVIHHKLNRGYGAAIKTGFSHTHTPHVATFDADGQHNIQDLENLFETLIGRNADMVIGNRINDTARNIWRECGKYIIRSVSKILMKIPVRDINSGIKIYDTNLAKTYSILCPDSFAFADILTLVFIHKRQLVLEIPVTVSHRTGGKSTVTIRTAFGTLFEIFNIVMLFNPMRIFLILSICTIIISVLWGLPIFLKGNGLSTGTLLGLITGFLLLLLGLIAEQLSSIKRIIINKNLEK